MTDNSCAGFLQPVVSEDVVNMRLCVNQILDASHLFLGKRNHLLQICDPLRCVDKDSAFLCKNDTGVASSDLCLCIDIRC